MRVLVACQHYWPEPFNTADVCEELVRRGHEVTVITALPNTGMPGNDIPAEWRSAARRDEIHNGVRVLRANLHPRKSGARHRVVNYLSFWRNAKAIARNLTGEYDVAFAYQFSPVMQADPALVWAKRYGKKCLLYSFDLWPASLLAGGFLEHSLPFKWMASVSKRIYSQADRLAVTSPLFDEYFRNELRLNIPDSLYLPQYADDVFTVDSEQPVPEGYDASKVNLTFAGNVGRAQSVETIVRAAAQVNDPRLMFHIVGSGSHLDACKELAAELGVDNLIFHGRKPLDDMPAYYAASDAMLVTFEASPMATYTLPRKVTTYLAAGRPVLAALDGETKRVINDAQCGLVCETADAAGFARIAVEFADAGNKDALGYNAYKYYESHFTKARFFDVLESELASLIEEGTS